jgi:hypothetical protein
MTREKSSEPGCGEAIGTYRSAPNVSVTTDWTNAACAGSFTVGGYSGRYSTSTSTSYAAETARQSRDASSATRSWACGEKVRTVASSVASSGMTLRAVPAWNEPTLSTTGSNTSNRLVIIVCRSPTSCAATETGSLARCGIEPCPPAPRTVTVSAELADVIVPGREVNIPAGCDAMTCMPYAAFTRCPDASSTPSASMRPAPSQPSSPGWNMKTTSPHRSSRRPASRYAAPTSIAVCRSWPHACISPASRLANSSPEFSATGSASMSARSSTAGPGDPPRSTAVTAVQDRPRVISSGRPSSASRTARCVRGRSSPTSGY